MLGSFTASFVLVLCLAVVVHGDLYMNSPRGSNNRLNERSANRNNGNRLFDSQNNNRGGYNKGDAGPDPATTPNEQYDFFYYMSEDPTKGTGKTHLTIEWTNQHGCGGNEQGDPNKLNCELIIQYMCTMDDDPFTERDRTRDDCTKECFVPVVNNTDCTKDFPPCPIRDFDRNICLSLGYKWLPAKVNDEFNCVHKCTTNQGAASKAACSSGWNEQTENVRPRDGITTDRPEYTEINNAAETQSQRFDRKNGNVNTNNNGQRGLHESWEWYDECYRRERNRGLFTADQNLRNNNLGYSSAAYTRQNPNANRRGYECPEERDYYPYWHPSEWVDIVVMTDRLDHCSFYRNESFNVKGKHLCRNTANCPNCIRYTTRDKCEANSGRWVEVPPHNVPAPECIQTPWSRVNHHGNGRFGQPNTYNWTLPFLGDGNGNPRTHRCVIRMRYNISTDDYDAWRVNATFNENIGRGIESPVQQNPNVIIGAENQALRLAINTAQFGRTFQDRGHAFQIVPRPTDTMFHNRDIYNVNVRGKRGNIVQVYPAVEYDFVPNKLQVSEDDLIHFQWTGSNTHNNGNPAGDGQAGDAGEGRGGTDRHNVVELKRRNFAESFPNTWEENTLFSNLIQAYSAESDIADVEGSTPTDEIRMNWAIRMATAGYYVGYDSTAQKLVPRNSANTAQLNPLLDNANPSYRGGVFRFRKGEYNYMCTRNHNFSNRDQKGTLVVTPGAA